MQKRGKVVWGALFAMVIGFALPQRGEAVVTLSISDAGGSPGSTVPINISIGISEGEGVFGTSQILEFTRNTFIAADSEGFALCAVAAGQPVMEIQNYTFRPIGCAPAVDCTSLQASLLPRSNPIVQGVLFSCQVNIAADAEPGVYDIASTAGQWTNQDGSVDTPIDDFTGRVLVEAVTPTPVNTSTPVPTNTATRTETPLPTSTLPPTSTRTVTQTAAPTATQGFGADDGCQMNPNASSRGLLLLLLPVFAGLAARRRNR